jgi:predicted hotdog family 3-hydroxylacyl-ACP dehydratase
MCWLDGVTRFDDQEIVSSATVRADNPVLRGGHLPAWALVELVAQAAAALRGSAERGYLVTVRDATFAAAECPVGERLVVRARLVDERGLYRYLEGEVHGLDGTELCRAALSVVLERPAER